MRNNRKFVKLEKDINSCVNFENIPKPIRFFACGQPFHCIKDAMAEWHVSGSESEGEGVKESAVSFRGFEGLRIPTARMVELLRTVESRKTLELDNARRKERKRKKKHKKNKVQSPGAVRNPEEVSETASEVRSTNSTTDCRDARR